MSSSFSGTGQCRPLVPCLMHQFSFSVKCLEDNLNVVSTTYMFVIIITDILKKNLNICVWPACSMQGTEDADRNNVDWVLKEHIFLGLSCVSSLLCMWLCLLHPTPLPPAVVMYTVKSQGIYQQYSGRVWEGNEIDLPTGLALPGEIQDTQLNLSYRSIQLSILVFLSLSCQIWQPRLATTPGWELWNSPSWCYGIHHPDAVSLFCQFSPPIRLLELCLPPTLLLKILVVYLNVNLILPRIL